MGVSILDPIAGLVVCGLIVKLGLSTALTSIKELTDTQEDTGFLSEIQTATSLIEGVVSCSKIRTRIMGPHVLVDMNIQVDPIMSVSAGHQVAERARLSILEQFPRISEVLVHINAEPEQEVGAEKLMRPQALIQQDVEKTLETIPNIEGASHIICHFLNGQLHVEVTIKVDNEFRIKEVQDIAMQARDAIEKIDGVDRADIHLELLGSHQILQDAKR